MSDWNPEEVVPGLKIPVHKNCARCVYQIGDGWHAYVQHDALHQSPTYQKLMMRDGGWRGAMKAFIQNYGPEGEKDLVCRKEIEYLEVIRVSRSGKSLITKAYFI